MHPDRVVVGADPGDEAAGRRGRRALRAARRRDRPHRRRQRRDDQARLQRLPGDEDLLHQRDRQRLRGGRRRRRARSPAAWASTSASARLPAAGHRLRRQLLPQGRQRAEELAGNTGYHFQLLTAVIEVNELQKRRVIGKLRSTSARWSASGSRCSASPSSPTPTTCARPRAWSSRRGCRARARGRRLRPGRRRSAPPSCCAAVEMCDSALEALEGADAAVLVTEWPEFAELDWARGRRADGAAAARRRPQLPRRRARCAAPASTYEGIGRDGRPATPARRSRRAVELMQAIVLVGGEGTRLRPLTADVPKPALTAGRPALPRLHGRVARPRTASRRSSSPAASCPTSCARRSARSEHGRGRASATSPSPSRWAPPGAIRFAADELGSGSRSASSPSTATSSPTSTSSALLRAHEERGARATLGLHPVEDSAAYGLVRRDERRRGARVPREDRRGGRRARSTPAPTCSSARCST